MPFWKGKYPKYHLIDPLHWGRLPIMYANSKLSNFAKENANGTLKHESTSQQFYWFPDDQYCFCKHSNPQLRKSTFLRKDPFDGQYMETRSFDIEARRVLKFHTGGGSHLWTVWQLPTEDNFRDKKFWLQIARQNISWNVVKNGNGALLWEGAGGVRTSPATTKRSGCK